MSEPASDPLVSVPLRVQDLMSPAPAGFDQFGTVVNAARRMRAGGLTAVPVTDERSQFLGMLSDRDIIENSVAAGQDPNAVTVGTLIRPGQPTIDPERLADQALLAMIVAQPLAELPVVQHGRLVGMLTVADLAVPLIERYDDDSQGVDQFWPNDSKR